MQSDSFFYAEVERQLRAYRDGLRLLADRFGKLLLLTTRSGFLRLSWSRDGSNDVLAITATGSLVDVDSPAGNVHPVWCWTRTTSRPRPGSTRVRTGGRCAPVARWTTRR